MRRHRWFVGGAVLLAACADRPGPALSVTPDAGMRAMAPDGYEAPSYASESAVPPEYAWAEVRSHRERVSWDGRTANGYGSMEYFGNRGRIELEMQVLKGYSTVGTTRTEAEQPDFFPAVRVMGIPLPYTLPEHCGQTANLTGIYSARTILFVNTSITEIGPDVANGHASATQSACPGSSDPCAPDDGEHMESMSPAPAPGANASPDEYLYDPYDPGYGTTTPTGCSGETGGSSGDGSGDGGGQTFAQMCGSMGGTLYYDYGCIEQYNGATGNWDTIWCGTYSVCET